MRHQLILLLTAIGLFTRLPVPAREHWSAAELSAAIAYLPLVGWLLGGLMALAYLVLAALLPPTPAVVLVLAGGIVLTGAFHEDGFIDSCDGLGGSREKARILAIMKDSRVGSFGVIGFVLLLLAKASALVELAQTPAPAMVCALLVAAPLSRLAAVSVAQRLPYARDDASSKMRATTQSLTRSGLFIAAAGGLLPLLLLPAGAALVTLVAVALTTLACGHSFRRRVGGYTGDLLGATQQLGELACYLALLAAAQLW